ncbi:MAG: site-specific integrase [Eubacterium sp.]|nr:site-specific integrase [Eubacterium sp.]
MWSQKRPNGNVTYSERYKDPLTGIFRTVSVTIKTTGRKSDSKVAEKALESKISKLIGSAGKKEILLFGSLCDQYVEWQGKINKPQTAVNTQRHLATIRRLIGDDAIVKNLTTPIVSSRLWDDNPIRYNERITRFKAMLRWTYRYDYVSDVSYLDKITKAKAPTAREKDALKYLDHNEISRFLDGMNVWKWKELTEFLILTGMRLGEAIALNDDDVDTDSREISISKTYSPAISDVSTTKTFTSTRTIYMQDQLLEVCRRIKKEMREDQIRYVYRTNLFMSDDFGGYISHRTFEKYFRENTERILGRALTPHCLRHTHTAMLAEAGIPLEEISRRLGHTNSRITKEVYLHVTEKMKERAQERIKMVKIL